MTPKSISLAWLLPAVCFTSPPTYWYLKVNLSNTETVTLHSSPNSSSSLPISGDCTTIHLRCLGKGPRTHHQCLSFSLSPHSVHQQALPTLHPQCFHFSMAATLVQASIISHYLPLSWQQTPATSTPAPRVHSSLCSQGHFFQTHPRSLSPPASNSSLASHCIQN